MKSMLSAFFIASLTFALNLYTDIFVPFDRAALLLTNTFAIDVAQQKEQSKHIHAGFRVRELNPERLSHPNSPVVMTIEQEIFDRHYGGITPLDRCRFADSVIPVLATDPKLLFIDFDLSPLAYPTEAFEACQKKLDAVLDKYADTLLLIEPLGEHQNDNEKVARWMQDRKAAGNRFASAKINAALGVVLTSSAYENSVSNAATRFLNNSKAGSDTPKSGSISSSTPINYAGLGRFHDIKNLSAESLHDKVIFLGGTYGNDDYHITPIGEKTPGIDIQAYEYATTLKPLVNNNGLTIIAYFMDVMIAFLVAFIMNFFWKMHIDLANHKNEFFKEFAFIFYFLVIVAGATITLLFMWLAGLLLQGKLYGWQIWISPFPIIITVIFDGMVDNLLQHIEELKEKLKIFEAVETVIEESQSKYLVTLQRLKTAVAVVVILLFPFGITLFGS